LDPTRRKGVRVEIEAFVPLGVFDAGISPKLKCTVPRIRVQN